MKFTASLIILILFTPIFAWVPHVHAQIAQSLSVTPPLFQLTLAPGDVWQSSVKVVNNNPYELTVYAEVVNFEAVGEGGQGKFVPVINDPQLGSKATLAEWITIPSGPYTIAPERSGDVQFFVDIPKDAAPGGHFAAILISTQPPSDNGGIAVKTSQVVTSLFFVRIDGDVTESGSIREFTTEDMLVDVPETTFSLRFENKGNVLLQPRGDIVITNMWGKERGIIPVNNQTHFGNVLPKSIREFTFSWKGEPSLTDIGRYKAAATLTFGDDAKQNVDAVTYFYVIPLKATAITIALIIAFVMFVTYMIKLYVRRMLMLAGVDVDAAKQTPRASRLNTYSDDVRISSYRKVVAPLKKGAEDLRERLTQARKKIDIISISFGFIAQYKIFFIAVAVILISVLVGVLYISDAMREQRSYQVTIDHGDVKEEVDSEQILKDRMEQSTSDTATTADQPFTLSLVNASGEPGAAAKIAVSLESAGYVVNGLTTDTDQIRTGTVIVYDEALLKEAQVLSGLLGGVLITPRGTREESEMNASPEINVLIGKI